MPNPYQVTARLERLDPAHRGRIETIRARYAVGCDGARRLCASRSGARCMATPANHAWGVMDVLAVTDFPDVRFKTLIQSANDGSIIIIPREGGYLFRLYIELDKLGATSGFRSQHHRRRSDREGAAHSQAPQPRREGDRLVVGLRDRPASHRQVR
jgi:phenol 2-monooxygenase